MRHPLLPILLVAICAVSTVFAEPPVVTEPRRVDQDDDHSLARFPVARNGDLLLIPVSIQGRQHQFILDTGAMTNVIGSSLAETLGPLKRSERKYPAGFPQTYQIPGATLAGTEIAVSGDFAIFDLDALCRMSGYTIAGILGMPCLEGKIVQIDFDAGSVVLLKSVPEFKSRSFRLERDGVGHPTVEIEIKPGLSLPFIVDTGMASAGTGEMTSQLFNSLRDSGQIQLVGPPSRLFTVGGTVTTRKGKIDVFKLGDFEHRNLRVTSGSVNGLGLRYLSRYRVTLDFAENRAWFEPSRRFAESSVLDASGMIVCRIDGKTVVEQIHPDGPAAGAGIRRGDVLTVVDGQSVNEHSLFTLRLALCRPDRTLEVTLQRDKDELQRRLPLKNWQVAIQPR